MFRTIEQCRLDLVAHSIMAHSPEWDGFPSGEEDVYAYNSLDYMPCSAARVSFGNEDKTGKDKAADKKLMKYLADHEHMSPFEHQSATFLVEVPLFIRSQIMRHRTFAYNEISRRYTDENLEFWVPTTFRKQSESNRQASVDEAVKYSRNSMLWFKDSIAIALEHYENLLENEVCREQARAVLPQSLLTKFFMTGKYCPASR